MKKNILLLLFLLTAGLLHAQLTPNASGIIYVTPGGGSEGMDGSSWSKATPDLHNAIMANNVTKVFVAIGNYNVGEHSFIMKNGVALYGGFDPANGIVSLDDARIMPATGGTVETGSVLNGQNIRPVIWNVFTSSTSMNSSAILDGFTIMNGAYGGDGAGIRNIYASPTLSNLVIKNNTASYGGGIANSNNSSPRITNVCIVRNTATSAEGAAAMYNTFTSSPVLTNVTIAYNNAASSGAPAGAVRNSGSGSQPFFYNCIIWGNTINGNAGTSGVDIAGQVGALKNSITQRFTTNVTADNNLAGSDPKFTDANNSSYTLSLNSPAINAGNNTLFTGLNVNSKDLAGNARVHNFGGGGIIDMGAYESVYSPPEPIHPNANGILYVKPEVTGTGSGDSWDNATDDLHNAIHANGVQKVYVAVGNYNVGEHSFIMKNGVAIYGGFDPTNGVLTLNDNRILPNKNLGAGSVLNGQNARPVIWNVFDAATELTTTAVLDGFTVTNGKYSDNGAGIRNIYASPTLRNLVISNNTTLTTAYDRGGSGIYLYASSPVISNVLITGNIAGAQGGGIWNDNFSNPVLTNVQIIANRGSYQGGSGFYNSQYASATLTNVSITGNTSVNGLTGGVYNRGTLKLNNVTLAGNTANNIPSAIYNHSGNLQLFNSIVFGKIEGPAAYTAQYSLLEGHTSVSNGNIDATGMELTDIFTDPSGGNYTLKTGSGAINRGSNQSFWNIAGNGSPLPDIGDAAWGVDLNGNPRLFGPRIDAGAYEYQGTDALPVLFGNISAIVKNGQLLVYWTTEAETNNDHFLIQVSTKGIHFKTAQTIQSKALNGNSSELLVYNSSLSLPILTATGLLLLAFSMAGTNVSARKIKYGVLLFTVVGISFLSCQKRDLFKLMDDGKLFIRIVQVDKDGNKTMSKIVQAVKQ